MGRRGAGEPKKIFAPEMIASSRLLHVCTWFAAANVCEIDLGGYAGGDTFCGICRGRREREGWRNEMRACVTGTYSTRRWRREWQRVSRLALLRSPWWIAWSAGMGEIEGAGCGMVPGGTEGDWVRNWGRNGDWRWAGEEKMPDWDVDALCDGRLECAKTPRSDGGSRLRVAVQRFAVVDAAIQHSGRGEKRRARGERGEGRRTMRLQGHRERRVPRRLGLRWKSGLGQIRTAFSTKGAGIAMRWPWVCLGPAMDVGIAKRRGSRAREMSVPERRDGVGGFRKEG